jgi:hypothetical protein
MATKKSVKSTKSTKPAPKAITHIRFDANQGRWAVLDDSMNPIYHFTAGVIEDVTFGVHETSEFVGCLATTNTIGIASGKFTENEIPRGIRSAKNLTFDGKAFRVANKPVRTATKVYLMPDRKSLVWLK